MGSLAGRQTLKPRKRRSTNQEDHPQPCLTAAATSSSESEVETDGMCDWSASECKDYKVGLATVPCAASEATPIQKGYVGMARTLLSSQSTSTITKMSIYTYMERRHLAGSYRTASTNYPCEAPGSLLLDSSHRARKVRGVPQTQDGILSVDRRNAFPSDTSSMWQQCLSNNSQNFGSSQ